MAPLYYYASPVLTAEPGLLYLPTGPWIWFDGSVVFDPVAVVASIAAANFFALGGFFVNQS